MPLTNIYQNLSRDLGGQVSAAKALGISQPTMSGYINGRWQMSERVARRGERATDGKYKAVDLCPPLRAELIQATT